jgi:hypothetical protein
VDRLIAERINLEDLSDPSEYGYLVEAVERVACIADEAIGHGVESFGPIVIHALVVNAITEVLSATIAQLAAPVETSTPDDAA